MAYVPLTKIPQQFFDNLGNPLVGGTLYAYLAGTSTATNMFSDNAGTVAGTSVVLDSRGEPTTFKLIWIDSTKNYKFVLKDSTGTTIWTIDNISGDDSADASMVTYVPAGSGAVTTTVQAKLRESVSVKDFGAVGDGVTDDTAAFVLAIAASKQIYVPNGTYLLSSIVFNTTGQSGVKFQGQSTTNTILKATAAATNFFSVYGNYNQYNTFESFSVDMSLMTNNSSSRGIYLKQTFGNSFRNVNIINAGTSTRPLYIDVGTYTTVFDNCDFGGLTGVIQMQGVSLSDAVTTVTMIGCGFGQAIIDYVVSVTFLQPVVQGALNKFVLSNCRGVSVLNGDIEGTGTYLVFGADVSNIASSNNALVGFSGTYSSGSFSGGYLMDIYGSTPYTMSPISGMTLNGVLTQQSSAAALVRPVIKNTNAAGQVVDVQFQNAIGSTYIGQNPTGDTYIDARGTGKVTLQQSGTDRLGVDTSNRILIGTAIQTTVGAAGTASALPAQPSGYARIVISGTDYVIPYYLRS